MNFDPSRDINEDFLRFESKVNQVHRIISDMRKDMAQGTENKEGDSESVAHLEESFLDDEFIVKLRDDRTVLNKTDSPRKEQNSGSSSPQPAEMDKFTFMQQVEKDANERAQARRERERVAEQFKSYGNEAFRKENYERAINMYTKAISYVKDSPILYNNRALSYHKLQNYRRAIFDCDFVLNKLDERNLRSWLYRAAAYKRLYDDKNFESSIKMAKKYNNKQLEYIDNFAEKIKNGQF